MKKVGFISLGCPKNLVDIEVMMGQLQQSGYQITSNLTKRRRSLLILAVLLNQPNRIDRCDFVQRG
jgi:tRNA A37 methylthiotransferase MiaB